jgi:hypothetical protein
VTTSARLAIILLATLGLVFACVGLLHAGAPTLIERLVAVQPSLASKKDEPVDAAELADAIVAVPKLTSDWAALLLTVAGHESALSRRIAEGRCRPLECDRGLAWGAYQQHRNAFNADVWGSPDIRVQTTEAARALRSAFYQCNRGALRKDWVARTINAYAGRSCDAVWPGLQSRLATFKRVRARL